MKMLLKRVVVHGAVLHLSFLRDGGPPRRTHVCSRGWQEKGRMATDLKRLKQHFKAYEPTLKELERKYQVSGPKNVEREMLTQSLTAVGGGHPV